MSKLALVLAASFFSFSALAHMEPGTHKGTTNKGTECSMLVGKMIFENGMHHPLTERVEVTVGSDKFMVGHPAVIDAATATASFNHDLFQAVLPTSTGAKALVITMVHSDEFEGPADFTFIENNWQTGEKTSIVCTGLKHD
ncbi:MAG TPA: hypothetical protein VM432_10500 [Bdellovibrionales bacterium]|nr:hypothetical protein [Bdellovibrionales bacterium]